MENIMSKKLLFVLGAVVLVSALLVGFFALQPSADELLTQSIEAMKDVTSAHAVAEVSAVTPEKNISATIEGWVEYNGDHSGGFRVEVLEASEAQAVGAVIVSDGETLWAYSKATNTAYIGTAEEAMAMLAEQEFEHEYDGNFQTFDHPETDEEAVTKLLEYVTAEYQGREDLSGQSTYLLELVPIAEQMPAEFAAVGGFVNLWLEADTSLPVGFEYAGGSMGSGVVTIMDLDTNIEIADDLFKFDIPSGTEVIRIAEMAPQSLSLDEAAGTADFTFLTPGETPAGSTLVDVLEVGGTIVQRYTFKDDGAFTVAQGITDETPELPVEGETVEVRGVGGALFEAEDGSQLLLTWTEGGLFYYVAGNLSVEQAFAIAESLQ
jgi:outer membrane lipoprotein-sorting protein